MKTINPTDMPSLAFDKNQSSHKIKLQSSAIGWIHSIGQKGTKFNLTLKDALGRVILEKKGCGNETDRYGEFVNFKGRIGEEIEIVVDGIQNTDKIDLFIN